MMKTRSTPSSVKALCHFRPRGFDQGLGIAERTHEGVIIFRQATNDPFVHQLPQAIHGKRDVQIAHDGRVIKADADMALQDIGSLRCGRNDAVGRVSALGVADEGLVIAQMQSGAGHQGDFRL